jgi:hypothetical protein
MPTRLNPHLTVDGGARRAGGFPHGGCGVSWPVDIGEPRAQR